MRIQQGGAHDTAVRDLSAAWSQIATYASAVDARLGRWLAETYSLGLTEYRSLVLLGRAPDRELRVNDLALRVGLNQSSATRLLSRLEAKGLAFRDTCLDDARGVYAVISEQGLSLVSEAQKPYETHVQEALSGAARNESGLDVDQLSRALALVSGFILD